LINFISIDLYFSFEIFQKQNPTLLKERRKIKMKIGYMRVSSSSQKLDRQEVIMEKLSVDRIYVDVQSGKNTSRPNLQKMLFEIQNGDCIC
jgi:predicted site-specific integrase-resolvase